MTSSNPPSNPDGPTGKLCNWVASTQLDQVPEEIVQKAKYVLLDGIACGLVGARLPWCEKAVKAITKMDAPGSCSLIGWNKGFSPLSSAILNSTFIQAFELDDYNSDAPVHMESIVIPALLAASEHVKASSNGTQTINGPDFLLACIVGCEVAPRIGHALWGSHILAKGWHSGPVFGHAASAAAVSRLLNFSPAMTEDAIGTACTQACGLMSAQFESDTKRMQHGFAARNGLYAALLSAEGFIGIKQVLEREYGGFLHAFSQGNEKTPGFLPEEVTKDLGKSWETEKITVKPYASMGGTHPTIDCVRLLQEKYPDLLSPSALKDNLDSIMAIEIDLEEVSFEHGGWTASRPLNAIGAQMNNAFCAASQLLTGAVFVQQFNTTNLARDDIWSLVDKTTTRKVDFPIWKNQRVRIQMADGQVLEQKVDAPRGVEPKLTGEEIREKARSIVQHVDPERWAQIEDFVLNMEKQEDLSRLGELVRMDIGNPIA